MLGITSCTLAAAAARQPEAGRTQGFRSSAAQAAATPAGGMWLSRAKERSSLRAAVSRW